MNETNELVMVLLKKAIVSQVEAIRQGLGKMLPQEVLDKYRSTWRVDPVLANGALLLAELRQNGISFPGKLSEAIAQAERGALPLDGVLSEGANELYALALIRFGSEEQPFGGWALGIYGYPSPMAERQIN